MRSIHCLQALRQALSRGQGRPSNPQPHPNNVLLDPLQNLFSKGFKTVNSVKYALQGRVGFYHLATL